MQSRLTMCPGSSGGRRLNLSPHAGRLPVLLTDGCISSLLLRLPSQLALCFPFPSERSQDQAKVDNELPFLEGVAPTRPDIDYWAEGERPGPSEQSNSSPQDRGPCRARLVRWYTGRPPAWAPERTQLPFLYRFQQPGACSETSSAKSCGHRQLFSTGVPCSQHWFLHSVPPAPESEGLLPTPGRSLGQEETACVHITENGHCKAHGGKALQNHPAHAHLLLHLLLHPLLPSAHLILVTGLNLGGVRGTACRKGHVQRGAGWGL